MASHEDFDQARRTILIVHQVCMEKNSPRDDIDDDGGFLERYNQDVVGSFGLQ
jgi:hypothetical protein